MFNVSFDNVITFITIVTTYERTVLVDEAEKRKSPTMKNYIYM